jgi:uncharacterized protein (TIGR01777 family)
MKIVAIGATGFVGRRLLQTMDSSWDVTVVSRDPDKTRDRVPGGVRLVRWNPDSEPFPDGVLDGTDGVVNLAGDNVADGRWTAAKKKRLADSRLITTSKLVDAMIATQPRPGVLINASAIGFYGPRGNEDLDEESSAGYDFLANLCQRWEAATKAADDKGIRTVLLRVGVVLGQGGGALAKMLLPFRLGAGGPLGSGRQWMSWIHIDDMVGLIIHALDNGDLSGPMNSTAPTPVTNREFSKTLGRVLRRPAFFPAPGFALRIVVGEFANVLLEGQKVLPRKAQASGYEFRFGELEPALRDVLG